MHNILIYFIRYKLVIEFKNEKAAQQGVLLKTFKLSNITSLHHNGGAALRCSDEGCVATI